MKTLSKTYQLSLVKELKQLLPKYKIGSYYSINDVLFKGKLSSFGFRVWTNEQNHVCGQPGIHYFVVKNIVTYHKNGCSKISDWNCISLCMPHIEIIKTLVKLIKKFAK